MQNNGFEITQNFDTTQEEGSGQATIKAQSKNDVNIVLDFNWTKDTYELIFYKTKSNL